MEDQATSKGSKLAALPVPSGTVAARSDPSQRELYERYLPIVRRIAMRTVRSLPPSVTLD
ncbi:MAG: hypothetical protein RJA70_4145, partial [Pseudomonadota bacterium]